MTGLLWFTLLWVVTPAIAYRQEGWLGVAAVPFIYAAAVAALVALGIVHLHWPILSNAEAEQSVRTGRCPRCAVGEPEEA